MKPVDKLKQANYKLTRPRRLVIEFLSKQPRPKTTREIVTAMRHRIDQVSVYRTIELFRSLGIIFDEFLLDERRYYIADDPHHHIVCRQCKKVECLPCHVEFTPPKNFTQVKHTLSLSGLCTQHQ